MSAGHRTATGHIAAARAVSWSCTCGEAGVLDYGLSVDAGWAMRLAAIRAATHRTLAALKEIRDRA